MSKGVRKVLDESRETGNPELDLQDKQITSLEELPGLCESRRRVGTTPTHTNIDTCVHLHTYIYTHVQIHTLTHTMTGKILRTTTPNRL